MSNDIGEAARVAVRAARHRDYRGDWTLSEDHCTAMIVDIVKTPVGRGADHPDARQERIDATARAIFAALFGTTQVTLREWYPTGSVVEPLLAADCDTAYRFAIALESARERALLKEAKP